MPMSGQESIDAPTVVLVGGANMDITGRSSQAVLASDSNPGQVYFAPGGVARNVAENLARLGLNTHLISLVGDDEFGRRIVETTRGAGVNVNAVRARPGASTAIYLSLFGPDGALISAVNDMAIFDQLNPLELQHHQALLSRASGIVADCNLPPETLGGLLETTSAGPVFVDAVSVAKCVRLLPWLHHIHTLKINRAEAQTLSRRSVADVDDARAAALDLHCRGVGQVVISLGEAGACWCDAQGETGFLPSSTRTQTIVNTSGAGDALLAGLVAAHFRQMPLRQAVKCGLACAELTLMSPLANAPGMSAALIR